MIDIPKITATVNKEETQTVELPPIVATIETKENFVELPKVVADIRPEKSIVGNLGTMVAGKGKDGKDGKDGRDGVNGKDGYTPVKGVDYFDGSDGKDGRDGKDGYSPRKGIDYFDGKNGIDGKDGYTPKKGIDYFDGKDGRDGKDGKNGRTPIKGIDYKDGKDGKDGLNGLNGTDGFSPKVSIEEIEGGHKITITDKDGEKSFDVMDGQGGNGDGGTGGNGFSPTISVEEIENGHRITINGIDGTKTIDVLNGKNGIDGKDGYTPIKGVDYFDGQPGADGKPGEPGYTPVKGVDYFDGEPGKDGAPGADGQPGKDGYSPVKGVDYWTDADKAEIIAMLKPSVLAEIKYTFLNYIESNGVQHINTGFVPNQNTRIVVDFHATTSSTLALFGARAGTSSKCFTMWLLPSTANPQYGSVAHTAKPISVSPTARLIYDMNKNVVKVGTKSVTFSAETFSAEHALLLFTLNNGGTVDARKVSGKMYSCKIYNNGTLVRDMVPARSNINGEVGLYDRVNDKFYTNAGTGTFTGG